MLNAHPMINCDEESIHLSKIANVAPQWYDKDKEPMRLLNAGISRDIVENALGAYILEIIGYNKQKPNLCITGHTSVFKTPGFFSRVLPNTKFILMIRDPRASLKKRILSTNAKHDDVKFAWQIPSEFQVWNSNVEIMFKECLKLGSKQCVHVFYEELVLNSLREIKKILKFLDVRWDEAILNVLKDKEENIDLSKPELINLNDWVGFFPKNITDQLENLAPMMKKLGYNIDI
jgi:protein-tyrosine sulfotransferase